MPRQTLPHEYHTMLLAVQMRWISIRFVRRTDLWAVARYGSLESSLPSKVTLSSKSIVWESTLMSFSRLDAMNLASSDTGRISIDGDIMSQKWCKRQVYSGRGILQLSHGELNFRKLQRNSGTSFEPNDVATSFIMASWMMKSIMANSLQSSGQEKVKTISEIIISRHDNIIYEASFTCKGSGIKRTSGIWISLNLVASARSACLLILKPMVGRLLRK